MIILCTLIIIIIIVLLPYKGYFFPFPLTEFVRCLPFLSYGSGHLNSGMNIPSVPTEQCHKGVFKPATHRAILTI